MAADGRLSSQDGARLLSALTEAYESSDEPLEVRRRALESVAVFGGEDVRPLIESAHQHGDVRLRQSAVFAMGRSCEPRYLQYVIADLGHVSPEVRFEAANALGEIGDEADAKALEETLDDQDLNVQLASVSALRRLGGNRARTLLRSATKSPEPLVASAAQDALAAMAADDSLMEVVPREAIRTGSLYGTPLMRDALGDAEDYDAPSREGWGSLQDDGTSYADDEASTGFPDDPEDEEEWQ
jgi:hypothetical protein